MKIVTDRGLQLGTVAVLDISASTIDKYQKFKTCLQQNLIVSSLTLKMLIRCFLGCCFNHWDSTRETRSFPLPFLEDVEEALMQTCKEVAETARKQATDNAILNQLCKMVEVDIPRSLFEGQGKQLYGAQLFEI